MNQEKVRNTIILKDIPSNIIDEAIIILKDNNQSNKKKMHEYAREEGKIIIEEYIKKQPKKKRTKFKSKYIPIIFFISLILILKAIISHIN